MERIAHIIFLIVMCVVFIRIASSTRNYGLKLRDLRRRCRHIIDDYKTNGVFPQSDDLYVVIENNTQKVLYTSNTNYDYEEFIRLMSSSESGKLSFQHAPDLHDTSHIIATYKDTVNDMTCLTFMNT